MKTHERAVEEYALGEIKFDGGMTLNGKMFFPSLPKALDITLWTVHEFGQMLQAIANNRRDQTVKIIYNDPANGILLESDHLWIAASKVLDWDELAVNGLLGTEIPLMRAILASSIKDLGIIGTYIRLERNIHRSKEWFLRVVGK